jgi:hypothetical protein
MEHLTFNMQDVGIQAQREAVAMRINTIVTLVYLPATFVSVSGSEEDFPWRNSSTDHQCRLSSPPTW